MHIIINDSQSRIVTGLGWGTLMLGPLALTGLPAGGEMQK